MKILEPLQHTVAQLDAATFRNYLIAFFVIIGLILGIIIWRYYNSVSSIHQRIGLINEARVQVKDLAIRSKRVQEQQRLVEALIKKDPAFSIIRDFERILDVHHLRGNLVREPETHPTEVDTGHTKMTLVAHLKDLSMETIAKLLDTLERHERITTEEIDITKPANGRTVNLNLTIATLEPASAGKATETTE